MTQLQTYVSARGRATALVVLVIVQLVALGLGTVACIAGSALLDDNRTAGGLLCMMGGGLTVLDSIVFLAAIVVFLTWVYRSIANLPALESLGRRFNPSEAVLGYFIPLANLVLGYQVMATIWTESQPAVVSENGYSLRPKTTLVNAWWALHLIAGFAGMIQFFMAQVVKGESGESGIEALRSTVNVLAVVLMLRMISGVLFLIMIRKAQRRQDEQWLDLERRRAAPQPDASALR